MKNWRGKEFRWDDTVKCIGNALNGTTVIPMCLLYRNKSIALYAKIQVTLNCIYNKKAIRISAILVSSLSFGIMVIGEIVGKLREKSIEHSVETSMINNFCSNGTFMWSYHNETHIKMALFDGRWGMRSSWEFDIMMMMTLLSKGLSNSPHMVLINDC